MGSEEGVIEERPKRRGGVKNMDIMEKFLWSKDWEGIEKSREKEVGVEVREMGIKDPLSTPLIGLPFEVAKLKHLENNPLYSNIIIVIRFVTIFICSLYIEKSSRVFCCVRVECR